MIRLAVAQKSTAPTPSAIALYSARTFGVVSASRWDGSAGIDRKIKFTAKSPVPGKGRSGLLVNQTKPEDRPMPDSRAAMRNAFTIAHLNESVDRCPRKKMSADCSATFEEVA